MWKTPNVLTNSDESVQNLLVESKKRYINKCMKSRLYLFHLVEHISFHSHRVYRSCWRCHRSHRTNTEYIYHPSCCIAIAFGSHSMSFSAQVMHTRLFSISLYKKNARLFFNIRSTTLKAACFCF